MGRHYFSSVPDFPHICFFSTRPPAAAAVAAAVVEYTRPRGATSNPPSATHGGGGRGYTPIAGLQLLLYFPASAWIPLSQRVATPSPWESSEDGGTAALPTAPAVGGDRSPPDSPCASRSRLVCIPTSSSRARPCSNILAHEAEPERTYSSRVFVRPMQSALTPGQSTNIWFSYIDHWSPTG